MTSVLVLCTANMCRSPMASALLARRLAHDGIAVPVSSAGLLRGGEPPPPEVISVMAAHGLDLRGHRSRVVTPGELSAAGLVLAMARAQLRQAVVEVPGIWPRAFTLKELVRRGEQAGSRRQPETMAGWLARVHRGRERAALLGDSPDDDVADPFGGPPPGYARTAALLAELLARLVDLCWPDRAHSPARPIPATWPAAEPGAAARPEPG